VAAPSEAKAQTGWSVRHNPCSCQSMSRRSSLFNARSKKTNRGNLRNNSTAAEAVLWTYLHRRKLFGKKFRRQSSVGPYIVDFYCAECRLVIELAGAPHFGPNSDEYDQQRTEYLERAGLKVIRFENRDVRDNIEFVLQTIKQHLRPNWTTPSAPSLRSAHPLFRLRPIGLALRALLCEEGNGSSRPPNCFSNPLLTYPNPLLAYANPRLADPNLPSSLWKLDLAQHRNHLVVDLPVGGHDLFSID